MELVILGVICFIVVFIVKTVNIYTRSKTSNQLNTVNMLVASEVRKLQKESFITKGKVVDAIMSAARNNNSEVSIPNLNLSAGLNRELENKGYLVSGNTISWRQVESAPLPSTEEKQ